MTLSPKAVPLAILLCLSSGAALAQSCSDAVDRLAQQHNVATESPRTGAAGEAATQTAPPATVESRGLTETQPPPGSRGAFTPPVAGAPPATSPPPASGSSAPQTSPPVVGAAGSDLTAADRGRMEALLKAAREADQRGDRAHCLERLREAEAVPGRPK